MHKSINLWLLVFAIMTVSVSHEKQQQANENYTNINVAEIILEKSQAVSNEAVENISTITEKSKARGSMATTIGKLCNKEQYSKEDSWRLPNYIHACE